MLTYFYLNANASKISIFLAFFFGFAPFEIARQAIRSMNSPYRVFIVSSRVMFNL